MRVICREGISIEIVFIIGIHLIECTWWIYLNQSKFPLRLPNTKFFFPQVTKSHCRLGNVFEYAPPEVTSIMQIYSTPPIYVCKTHHETETKGCFPPRTSSANYALKTSDKIFQTTKACLDDVASENQGFSLLFSFTHETSSLFNVIKIGRRETIWVTYLDRTHLIILCAVFSCIYLILMLSIFVRASLQVKSKKSDHLLLLNDPQPNQRNLETAQVSAQLSLELWETLFSTARTIYSLQNYHKYCVALCVSEVAETLLRWDDDHIYMFDADWFLNKERTHTLTLWSLTCNSRLTHHLCLLLSKSFQRQMGIVTLITSP